MKAIRKDFWREIKSTKSRFISILVLVALAVAFLAGLIIVPLVSLITPKMSKEKIDEIFTCYNTVVSVPKKMYLENDEDKVKED